MDMQRWVSDKTSKTPSDSKVKKIAAVFYWALTLLAMLTSIAKAADIDSFRTAGTESEIFDLSADGCISTTGVIGAVNDVLRSPPGSPESQLFAFIQVIQNDSCNNVTLKEIFGLVSITVEDFSTQAKSATLITNLPAHDFLNGVDYTYQVNLTWSCVSPFDFFFPDRGAFVFRLPDSGSPITLVASTSNVKSCVAQVSGTIFDGTSNLAFQDSGTYLKSIQNVAQVK